MAASETCAYCGRSGVIGREIVPYVFTLKHREWLCGIFTNPNCSAARYKAFREWLKKL